MEDNISSLKVSSIHSSNSRPEDSGPNSPSSVNQPSGGFIQANENTVGNVLSFTESLQDIHNLALSASLSLDACCYGEKRSTRGTQISGHNLATLSSVSISSSDNDIISGTNIALLPKHEISSSSGKPQKNKPVSKTTSSGTTDHVVPSCDCKEPTIGFGSPGTELSLAIASVVDNGAEQNVKGSHSLNVNPQTSTDCNVDKSSLRKDEMYMKLVQQVRELEVQLQERKKWAHQKALQAACKFSKDMAELKSLRLEHEEILRLKRDTQALEDSTMKRLTEMESALRKASAQVDRANVNVRKLETENAELRAEMEAAKLSASESNAKCQEVVKREKKSSKKIQAWEKQKAKMLDELLKQKQQISEVQEQLGEVKRQQHEAEIRWRQEEKAKEEAITLANAEKWAREQVEASTKRKEDIWIQKSDADLQRHRDDIKRLEDELEQLKIASESCNKEQKSGIVSNSSDTNGLHALKDTRSRLLQELADLQDSRGDIRRDWECVMCMSEESSVVFLPCAHQIVCVKCNELHQKQGMSDCPSCRTIIQERIHVIR